YRPVTPGVAGSSPVNRAIFPICCQKHASGFLRLFCRALRTATQFPVGRAKVRAGKSGKPDADGAFAGNT
ncbi:MAG: hypothetical protein NWQ23_13890, partial [Yoonia sp.]|uniref:hypothetical protein n=1 Tax=Yoonia sp. TaxID=2212373 RepID=UPI00273E679A